MYNVQAGVANYEKRLKELTEQLQQKEEELQTVTVVKEEKEEKFDKEVENGVAATHNQHNYNCNLESRANAELHWGYRLHIIIIIIIMHIK